MKNTPEEILKFAVVITALAEEFGSTLSDDNIELKFLALEEYTIEEIQQAATWLIKNREQTYPATPRTKEIIDAIDIIINGKLNTNTAAALEADKVLKNLKCFGRECSTVFKDPITRYLMSNRWSFWQLGNMPENDLKWFRKEFIEAYQEMEKDNNALPAAKQIEGEKIPVENLKQLIA